MGIDPLSLTLLATSVLAPVYNTAQTQKKQDRALATDIRNQSAKRREQEARVNEEVTKLTGSSSADERTKRLTEYADALRRGNAEVTAGFGGAGGETFQKASAEGKTGVLDYGKELSSLMSRIDAPVDQRRGEGVSFGNLGIDLDNVSRAAQGQHFLDQLRYNSIKRNPWIDAASSFVTGVAGGMNGAASGTTPNGLSKSMSQYGMVMNYPLKKLGTSTLQGSIA
jgi:hypothetical protein